jgi:hypothetical protein
MNKLQSYQTLEALGQAKSMDDMSEKEVMSEILQAWVKMPPMQGRAITRGMSILQSSAPQLGERGVIELSAKLGMFLKANDG